MFDDHFVRMLLSSDSKDFKYGGELDFHLTKEERAGGGGGEELTIESGGKQSGILLSIKNRCTTFRGTESMLSYRS